MKIMLGIIAACAASMAAAQGLDQPQPEHDAGIAMAEAAVRSKLRDPESARFDWPYPFRYGTFRLSRSIEGWITCGAVNAKNGFGGYVGREAVLIVIRDGAVKVALVDDARLRLLAKYCNKNGMPL